MMRSLISFRTWIVLLALVSCASSFSTQSISLVSSAVTLRKGSFISQGKISNDEKDAEQAMMSKPLAKDLINLPPMGVIGYEPGSLFKNPIELYDPARDTSDLPGEDGSDEQLEEIERRIKERVASMKLAGEWDDNEELGRDPLANESLLSSMIMHAKVSKPFESVGEFALTFTTVLCTTALMAVYLAVSKFALDSGLGWFLNTDFDSNTFS
jgi:hypothetical protein